MKETRTNQQWLDELPGRLGIDVQRQTHLDLANYLYIVAYNYLLRRQGDVSLLNNYAVEELAALAEEFAQDILEKLARNGYALLAKFHGAGSFTAWCAIIVRNHIAGALRRPPYTHSQVAIEAVEIPAASELEQAALFARNQTLEAMQDCLARLSEHYRTVLIRCIAEGEAAQTVADALGRSVGAVNLLVLRAKRQMRRCLTAKGYGPEVLALF
jgi:RNA polymerase sigma factor (sigma-70 family)